MRHCKAGTFDFQAKPGKEHRRGVVHGAGVNERGIADIKALQEN
jgi:hypothetical protein